MEFSTSMFGAIAALTGSLVGACASVTANLVGQRIQFRGTRVAAELDEQKELYGRFVEEAVPLFVDSIERTGIDAAKLIRLYAIVARIRLTSSNEVLRAAEDVGKQLLEAYEKPPESTVAVLARYVKGDHSPDPLRDFTEACRIERDRVVRKI